MCGGRIALRLPRRHDAGSSRSTCVGIVFARACERGASAKQCANLPGHRGDKWLHTQLER